jgi:exodeoxyribonuclease III
MRVVTWNVNSLKVRMPRVLELLEQHRPDVVCLQETKANPNAFPELELQAAGYESVDASGGRWAGVAILARKTESALTEPHIGLPGDPVADEARWIEATADGIRFVSVYVPNGRTLDSPEYPRKLAFLEAMARRIAELQAQGPLIVCGDMNIAPADADVYDPAAFVGGTHVSAPERDHLAAILDAGMVDAGMVDAYRALHPDEVQYTWWDYRAGNFHKGLGLRIDLALVSESLAPRLTACGIYRDYRKGHKPSDHAPLAVDL